MNEILLFSVSGIVDGVPPRIKPDQCQFPLSWEDVWVDPKEESKE